MKTPIEYILSKKVDNCNYIVPKMYLYFLYYTHILFVTRMKVYYFVRLYSNKNTFCIYVKVYLILFLRLVNCCYVCLFYLLIFFIEIISSCATNRVSFPLEIIALSELPEYTCFW